MRTLPLLILALYTQIAAAGEAITAFAPGKPPPPEALQNVAVKAVVAEFLDPDGTHLGKELGYLVWREILTAVSDQRGAGVILAHPAGNERLVDMLQQNYHQAALEIAASQKARMALWGALSEDNGQVVIDSYLSLVGEVSREELAIKVKSGYFGHQQDTGFTAGISRTRFNFPRVRTTRQALFERPLLVQSDADVHEQAGPGRILTKVHLNETLQADGMEGEWFQIRLPQGSHGYVHSSNMYVPPRAVDLRNELQLSAQPGSESASGDKLPRDTTCEVLAGRYGRKLDLWYHIKTVDHDGWVPAYRVRTRFSLPIVNFIAGLYRYQLGRYDLAAAEFEQYTRLDGVSDDAPSLSTAYQLLAASRMMSRASPGSAFDALRNAIAITPFDASAYTLRALSTLADSGRVGEALPDLIKALDFDPDQADARNTVARLLGISQGNHNPLAGEGGRIVMGGTDVRFIHELAGRYKVAPQ